MTTPPDWEATVGKPTPICESCQEGFAPGQSFVSLLEIVEGRLHRRVLCAGCHERRETHPFAFWRTRLAGPDAGKPRPLDLGFLIELFRRLHAPDADPANDAVRYIVTLLLVRKKVLAQARVDVEEHGDVTHEFLVTVFMKRDDEAEEFRTAVPEITPEKMESIKDDLGRIFNLGD